MEADLLLKKETVGDNVFQRVDVAQLSNFTSEFDGYS